MNSNIYLYIIILFIIKLPQFTLFKNNKSGDLVINT